MSNFRIIRPVWAIGRQRGGEQHAHSEHLRRLEALHHRALPQPDVRNFAWHDYGLSVGIWRLFDHFEELQIPACLLVDSAVYDYAPQVLERARARGDEIVAHGRTNSERQGDLD